MATYPTTPGYIFNISAEHAAGQLRKDMQQAAWLLTIKEVGRLLNAQRVWILGVVKVLWMCK